MQDNRKDILSGFHNARLNQSDDTNCEMTAAWNNMEQIDKETNVNIPSEYQMEKAKNWVDNGSQL